MAKDKANHPQKTKVFLSYSRKDGAFAEELLTQLKDSGFDAYLDRHDILPGEPWQERLGGLIAAADTIVFCMSPHSITSAMCDWEVNEAERLAKRILPVVVSDPVDDSVPQRLKRLNYIFLRNEAEQADEYARLIGALDTDVAWVREHTRLGELAIDWDKAQRPASTLLRDENITAAEKWLVRRPSSEQAPTQIHISYIEASRAHAIAEQHRAKWRARIIAGASLAALTIMSVLGWFFYTEWQGGLRRESLALADAAQIEIKAGNVVTGALLALEGLPDSGKDSSLTARLRPFVSQAQNALDAAHQPGLWHDRVLKGHNHAVTSAVFSPDGSKILTASKDNAARLWNAINGTEIAVLEGHQNTVNSAVFSPDGSKILTASYDGTARLWDDINGTQVAVLKGHESSVNSAVFSPDGSKILTASKDIAARLWDADDGTLIVVLKGHEDHVTSAVFSPDSRKILTASRDHTARLWDATDGTRLAVLNGHNDVVTSAKFSPDGRKILTVSDDNTVWLWRNIPIQQEINKIKETLTRCLTPSERARYHLNRTPPHWCHTTQKYPYHDKLPPPDWTALQISTLRQNLAGWAGLDSPTTKWLERQDWLHSAHDLLQKGLAASENKKHKIALSFYQRSLARTSEFKANIRPHIEEAKNQIAQAQKGQGQ